MDIVITYVNGLDPEWQKSYEKHTNTPILEKRFRDWGTLKYLFRGIEKNMPFRIIGYDGAAYRSQLLKKGKNKDLMLEQNGKIFLIYHILKILLISLLNN